MLSPAYIFFCRGKVNVQLLKLKVFRMVAYNYYRGGLMLLGEVKYYCSGLFIGEVEGLSLGCILLLRVAFLVKLKVFRLVACILLQWVVHW